MRGWYYPNSLLGKLISASFSKPKGAHECKCKPRSLWFPVLGLFHYSSPFTPHFLPVPDHFQDTTESTIFTEDRFLHEMNLSWAMECHAGVSALRKILIGSFLWFLSSLQKESTQWSMENRRVMILDAINKFTELLVTFTSCIYSNACYLNEIIIILIVK